MKLIINHSSQQPIYEQIAEQIKASVLNGAVREGEMLPSVRSLSKDLKISALTVKKAYDALEHEGFVNTVHGKGSFIAGTSPQLLWKEAPERSRIGLGNGHFKRTKMRYDGSGNQTDV